LANHLSGSLIEKSTNIPFRKVIDMRNYAAHGYLTLKPERVWNTIKKDVPELELNIKTLIG